MSGSEFKIYYNVTERLKEFAEKINKPHIDTLVTDVYDEVPTHLQTQLKELKNHINKYPEAYPVTAGKF